MVLRKSGMQLKSILIGGFYLSTYSFFVCDSVALQIFTSWIYGLLLPVLRHLHVHNTGRYWVRVEVPS
ncbi:hypothetical protein BDW71DRAFT_188830 [Aspergillus fruticulosus]